MVAAILVVALACGAAFWANELLRWAIPAHRHQNGSSRGAC